MENGKVVIVDELTTIMQKVSSNIKTQITFITKVLKSKLKTIKTDFNSEKLRVNTGELHKLC